MKNNVLTLIINYKLVYTHHALITLIDDVSKTLVKENVMAGVFLDLRNAFSTVTHNVLFRKLCLWNQGQYS